MCIRDSLNAEIVVTILEESGLTVERTADGELCIEALKAQMCIRDSL